MYSDVAYTVFYTMFKISSPLLQTHLIQFVVHGFQQNIIYCTILTLLMVTPIMTYTPSTGCAQCNVIMMSELVFIKIH